MSSIISFSPPVLATNSAFAQVYGKKLWKQWLFSPKRCYASSSHIRGPEKQEALKHDEGLEATNKKRKEEANKDLFKHFDPQVKSDRVALKIVKLLRVPTDYFFKEKYGHRAVVLETIAAVPGMVGGMLTHMKSLRQMKEDKGIIKELLEETQNERMHLMTFIHVAQPTRFERLLVLGAQGSFFLLYAIFYILSPRMAHRFVGYLEEEAIVSYTNYLEEIDAGRLPNDKAPQIAIEYWNLPANATLRDVVIAVRADEVHHRDVNHRLSRVVPI